MTPHQKLVERVKTTTACSRAVFSRGPGTFSGLSLWPRLALTIETLSSRKHCAFGSLLSSSVPSGELGLSSLRAVTLKVWDESPQAGMRSEDILLQCHRAQALEEFKTLRAPLSPVSDRNMVYPKPPAGIILCLRDENKSVDMRLISWVLIQSLYISVAPCISVKGFVLPALIVSNVYRGHSM